MARTAKKTVTAQAQEDVSVEGSTEASVAAEAKTVVIQPLSIDFNKEELNTLAMKVNEIINHINQ